MRRSAASTPVEVAVIGGEIPSANQVMRWR